MELEFERADLLQLEPISCRGTVKLLPPGKKKKQKLCAGDDTGNISCHEFKKGEPIVVFNTNFFDGPVSNLTIGGIHTKKDKIFGSNTQKIVGVTKRGKEFFKLTSSLTESINHVFVEETKIWTACEYIYNVYENGQDSGFYMCHDQIHSMAMEYVVRQTDFDALLGCQDNTIRVVSGSNLAFELPTSGPVMALCSTHGEESRIQRASTSIIYGTNNGNVTNLQIVGREGTVGWTLQDPNKSSITAVKTFDINQNGSLEVVISRDDGRIDVYANDINTKLPTHAFGRDIGESIRAIDIGRVNTAEYNEIIVAAYSGKILTFTSEPTQQRAPDDTYGRTVQTVNNENRIKSLKKDIETLKAKVEKEKSKLKVAQQKASVDTSKCLVVDFSINSKFALNVDEAAYALSIEIQSPIDLVVLRSPVHLDLIDTDLGSAVVSITPQTLISPSQDGSQDYRFVATYRCQSQEKRLNILIRTTEGEFGDLLIIVVSATDPKAAKVVRYPMKPLSLQTRVNSFTEQESSRPRNRIRFSGNVGIQIFHEWILSILPDIPSRIDENSLGESYFFRNVYTGAVMTCSFKRNELIFECENASTIAIIKENILRYATSRRIQLEEQTSLNNDTVVSFLSLIRGRLEYQLSLARKMNLIEALQEITIQENDLRWLSIEYNEIIRDQENIRKEYAQRAKTLERLTGIITDLYVDWHKLHGVDARSNIPTLQSLVLNGSFNEFYQMILKY
mmetsp:Transcript_298/g.283  ORF Transcript_298/g.283 Transcript_298/m.283 type:complete len:734 (-) Transcript_298:90-2291(-)